VMLKTGLWVRKGDAAWPKAGMSESTSFGCIQEITN